MFVKDYLEQLSREAGATDVIFSGHHRSVMAGSHGSWRRVGAIVGEYITGFAQNLAGNLEGVFDREFAFDCRTSGKRVRCHYFKSMGEPALAGRFLPPEPPTALDFISEDLLEKVFLQFKARGGLILTVGRTGSGKTTTIVSVLEHINRHDNLHILTIEDPIEYILKPKAGLITQREIGLDIESFDLALRQGLRQRVNILFVGEIRDKAAALLALTAAEAGHLVFATLHGNTIEEGLENLIARFPVSESHWALSAAATVLRSVLYQEIGRDQVLRYTPVLVDDAIRSLVRTGKLFQIDTHIDQQKRSRVVRQHSYPLFAGAAPEDARSPL